MSQFGDMLTALMRMLQTRQHGGDQVLGGSGPRPVIMPQEEFGYFPEMPAFDLSAMIASMPPQEFLPPPQPTAMPERMPPPAPLRGRPMTVRPGPAPSHVPERPTGMAVGDGGAGSRLLHQHDRYAPRRPPIRIQSVR